MSTLFLLILFASVFAVPSETRSTAGECILSPRSIGVFEREFKRAVRGQKDLACHSDAKEYVWPAQEQDDFKNLFGNEGILGKGSSGQVEKVEVKVNDPLKVCAMKVYHPKISNQTVLNELKISTLLSLDPEHHFVKPYYFFLHHFPADPNSLPGKKPERRLVMDYVAGGDLFHLLKTVGLVHWEDTISLAYLLLHALKYAHSKGVIYRDLKPENILIDADTGFKITDFDQAARFKKDKQYPKDFAGTDVYMAPELFLDEPYTETVDTWSVGAVLLKAIEGEYMHLNDDYTVCTIDQIEEKFRKLIKTSEPILLPAEIPEEGLGGLYRNFLSKLLEYEVVDETTALRKKRLTCAEMLESKEGTALFDAYEKETGKKLTQLAFSPEVVKGKLIGYNYHGRQQEHYRDWGVLAEDEESFIPIFPKKDGIRAA